MIRPMDIHRSVTYPDQHLVGIFEVFEQYRDLALVCTALHILAKVPLNALHGGQGPAVGWCSGSRAETIRLAGTGAVPGQQEMVIWRSRRERCIGLTTPGMAGTGDSGAETGL